MKKFVLAGLLAACAAPVCAQAPLPDADPALWVVKDADTTVYLFGTFHMLDGKRDWFNDEVKTAFDASDELVLEAIMPENPADLVPTIMKYATDPSGKTLSSKLTPEVKAKLATQIGEQGIAQMDGVDPWFVTLTLVGVQAQKLGLNPEHGPEKILTNAAKAKNVDIGELESMDEQLKMFDSIPSETQVRMLGDTLEDLDKVGETLTPMLNAWSSGDTEGLVKILNESVEDDPEAYKWMFSDRNARWAEWIDARMDKPGTVFVAVGAGHLGGKDSVQDLLAAKGIKSERVKP
jgi:uncharacterized protein